MRFFNTVEHNMRLRRQELENLLEKVVATILFVWLIISLNNDLIRNRILLIVSRFYFVKSY